MNGVIRGAQSHRFAMVNEWTRTPAPRPVSSDFVTGEQDGKARGDNNRPPTSCYDQGQLRGEDKQEAMQ
ncbi:hypothetical protein CUC53_01195 [Aeromonas cavernicola]|uniref:Uncharacterized protein n=1 Tax=Aeromonas cavernicola TaxID=1006623 RepID=A0A2H9U9D8_9GAMM|nr:hypothetical protein CUC53_01195 [Aeromonas cavernicola]